MTFKQAINRATLVLTTSARHREIASRIKASPDTLSFEAADLRHEADLDREAAALLGNHSATCLWTQLAPLSRFCQTACGLRYTHHHSYRCCPGCGHSIELKLHQ